MRNNLKQIVNNSLIQLSVIQLSVGVILIISTLIELLHLPYGLIGVGMAVKWRGLGIEGFLFRVKETPKQNPSITLRAYGLETKI